MKQLLSRFFGQAKPPSASGGDIEQWIEQALAAQNGGELGRARTLYERVLAADPRHIHAMYLLGALATRQENWAEAEGLFRQALALNGGIAALHAGLASSLQGLGRTEEAAEAFRAALALDPEYLDAHTGLAMELQRLGRIGEAYESLRNWLRIQVRRRRENGPPSLAKAVEIPGTTLVCVDCRHYDLAADALRRCVERCRFERALFFTDTDVRVDGVETVRIDPIRSVDEYSTFVMKGLDRHIDSEFALLVQYDGYILNPQCWSADFQDYDYVGARWPFDDDMAVGNGGFSLRSKRLLRALQDPEVRPFDPEDMAICRTYRPLLEKKYGVRFAPTAVAERFAFEAVPPPGATFGFHSLGHAVNVFALSEAELATYRPPALTIVPR